MSLQSLYELDRSFPDRLDKLLHVQKYVEELQGLPDQELLQLVDYLNDVCSPMSWRPSSLVSQVLVRLDRIGGKSRKCLHVLRRICGSRKILPTNYELSKELLLSSEQPKSSGGFCDAYEGTLSVKVCIKRLKISVTCDQEKIKEVSVHLTSWRITIPLQTSKQFCKEAVVWKQLNHPNIVPFKGITFDPPQLISEWMPGGELRDYVRNNRDADLVALVRTFLQTSTR